MEKHNKASELIEEVVKILNKTQYRKNRYENDIKWFESRSEYMDSNKVKVAIIGVTSSGKSTLVNALLGEKVLPVSIKPSSSIVITCSKGINKEAFIYFRNGESLHLNKEELNEEIIKKYADENENENNKYDVQQIDIMTPSFVFGDNIQIIDSPGLDACNLEMHERLTLEILLPTIDICVFLTTVKASSDAVNKEKIQTVLEKNKEIILVQNMIDSVEPKIGKNGIILESKEDILKKHKERSLNLLKSCGILNKTEDDIIQISALYALKAVTEKNQRAYEISNADLFIDSVNNAVSRVYPKIKNQKLTSIGKRISLIINMDREILNADNSISVTNYDIDKVVLLFQKSRNMISEKINLLDKLTEKTIQEIKEEKSSEIGSYLEIVWQVNKENKNIEKQILKIVKDCENAKIGIYRKLNLDARESYVFPSDEIIGLEIDDIKLKHETRSRLVKKEGRLNRGKRLVSTFFNKEWGYDKEIYNEDVIDKDSIINKTLEVCKKNKTSYISILYDWSSNYSKCINHIYAAIKENSENIKKKKVIDYDAEEINEVYSELVEIENEIFKETEIASDIDNKILSSSRKLHSIQKVNIKKSYFDMYKLANVFFNRTYYSIQKYINNDNSKNIYWLYDCNLGLQFIYRMHNAVLTEDEVRVLYTDGYYEKDDLIIIFENCINKDDLYSSLQSYAGRKYNMYCMINAIQISSTEKHILNSVFLNQFLFKNNVKMNIVIDSSREFINADIIGELLKDVFELKNQMVKVYNINKMGYVLINSRNPIYNTALIKCQNEEKFILSSYKAIKERILENILSRGTEERKNIEEILLYFMNINEK